MITPRVATGTALRNAMGCILLIRRGRDAINGACQWSVPGGKLDPMETLAFGAAREVLEEVGVEARVQSLGVVTEDAHWGADLHFVTHYHQAVSWTGEPRIMEPHKHDGLEWIHEDDLVEIAEDGARKGFELFPPTRDFILFGGLDRLMK